MIKLPYKLSTFFILIGFAVFAQSQLKDSVISAPLVGISYSFQVPGGDMADRFGVNSKFGSTFLFKTKKNIILGIDGNYMFGRDIKQDLFKNISTSDGHIINSNGEYADVRSWERGISTSLHIGKLFAVWGPNKNSGIISTVGLGYLQHRVKIDVIGNNVPQLGGDYKKGYDKFTNGLAVTEFVGYLFLSNNRMINFFGGFEFVQAFTKSRRSYDFDLMARDTRNRTDLFYGFRVGWILPLYEKLPNDYYYY